MNLHVREKHLGALCEKKKEKRKRNMTAAVRKIYVISLQVDLRESRTSGA